MITFHFSIDGGLVVRLAAVRSWRIVSGDSAAIRVGVKEQERLEVIFDAFADNVFPPGADLPQKTEELVSVHARLVLVRLFAHIYKRQ